MLTLPSEFTSIIVAFAPLFFNGVWALCPDPVDRRHSGARLERQQRAAHHAVT